MKKFVRLDSILLARKDGNWYVWSKDGGEEVKAAGDKSTIAKIYNGTQLHGWVLLRVKNYYDKIQG